jgi:hypothetical protein
LPSSQLSGAVVTPLPQTVQKEVQPSLGSRLPSSHSSPCSCTPLPHDGGAVDVVVVVEALVVDVVEGAGVVLLVVVVGAVVELVLVLGATVLVVVGTVLDVVVDAAPVVVVGATVVVVLVDVVDVTGSSLVVVLDSMVLVVVLPIVDDVVVDGPIEVDDVELVEVVVVGAASAHSRWMRRPVTIRFAHTPPVNVLALPSWNRAPGAETNAWTCTPAPSFTAVPPTCRIGVGIVPFGPSVLPFSRRTSPVTSMVVWPTPRTSMDARRPTRSEQNW